MRRLLGLFLSNWISAVGTSLTALACLALATGSFPSSSGAWSSPHQGLGIPARSAVLVVGPVVVAVGLIASCRTLRARRAARAPELSRSLLGSWAPTCGHGPAGLDGAP